MIDLIRVTKLPDFKNLAVFAQIDFLEWTHGYIVLLF